MGCDETKLYQNVSAAVLAGGKSSRMGKDKAFLLWAGDTFLNHAIGLFSDFSEVLVSVAEKSGYEIADILLVVDQKKGYGPLEGIYQILTAASYPWVFITAVDMPLLSREFIQKMLVVHRDNTLAIVPQANGCLHPLCALYHKDILPILEQAFLDQHHSLKHILHNIPHTVVDVNELGETAKPLTNLNTITEYTNLLGENYKKNPSLICICGVKNSGKTTLIEKIIQTLSIKGYKVAAIKHDGHDFNADVPGTDSYRMQQAGAYGTAVFSDQRFLIYKEWEAATEKSLIEMFPESDIIILEGLKHSFYPKLEIIRNGVSNKPTAESEGLLALISDIPTLGNYGYPLLNLNNVAQIVSFILEHTSID